MICEEIRDEGLPNEMTAGIDGYDGRIKETHEMVNRLY
jgi:hypothetical protein